MRVASMAGSDRDASRPPNPIADLLIGAKRFQQSLVILWFRTRFSKPCPKCNSIERLYD